MVAGIIALKESADKAPALAWLMWGYYLDLVEKHDRSRLAAAPGNPDTDTAAGGDPVESSNHDPCPIARTRRSNTCRSRRVVVGPWPRRQRHPADDCLSHSWP